MRSTSNPALCDHVHLPVQSGSSAVLERMQRLYTRDDYMRRIEWMKNAKRDIAITTDIIVGFPGETEADFNETVDLIDQVEYDRCSSSNIRNGPNTPALAYEDHIPEEEKTRRFLILQERQRAIQMRRNAAYVGKTEEVHVEGYNRQPANGSAGPAQNKTLNFHDVRTAAPTRRPNARGQYLDVLVTRAGPNSLAGQRVASCVCSNAVRW